MGFFPGGRNICDTFESVLALCAASATEKLRNLYTPPVLNTPAEGNSVGILQRCLVLAKLE